jgi:hypothetical protein
MSDGRFKALRRALSWPMARRSFVTALFVGSILNVINQGDAVWSWGPLSWWKMVLTYCVPFCVATFGAYSAYRAAESP